MGEGKVPGVEPEQPGTYDIMQALMAEEMYNTTKPMRQMLTGQYEGLLSGDLDVRDLPQYAGMDDYFDASYRGSRPALEGQYTQARENILGSVPRGGGLTSALGGLERSRAGGVADLSANIDMQRQQSIQSIIQDMINKAYGYATGTPAQAIAGAGSAASNVMQRQLGQMAGYNPLGTLGSIGSQFAKNK